MGDAMDEIPEGQRRVSIHERGSVVVIEIACHDAYEAMQLADTLSTGLESGWFIFEFGDEPPHD